MGMAMGMDGNANGANEIESKWNMNRYGMGIVTNVRINGEWKMGNVEWELGKDH